MLRTMPPEDDDTLDIYDIVEDDPRPASRAPQTIPAGTPGAPSTRLYDAQPRNTMGSVRCPKCKYDLKGSRPGRCPECGTPVTMSSLQRSAMQPSLWRDVYREPVLWLLGGLLVGCVMWGVEAGLVGAALFPVYALILAVSGWIVFIACSFIWIGFDQPLHTTVVQLAAAYTATAAIGSLTAYIPLPIIPWLIDVACLVGLLSKLLDLELNDAILVAFLAWAAKVLVAVFVVASFMA